MENKLIINFIFSLGYRCNAAEFLIKYNLRKMSGPFDFMFIDFDSACKIINNNFNNFLTDIVLLNISNKNIKLLYNNNVNDINLELYELIDKNIQFEELLYNNIDIYINQNYIENIDTDIYNWKKFCIFRHHDLSNKIEYDKIKYRIENFKNITLKKLSETGRSSNCKELLELSDTRQLQMIPNNTCLLHITKIINCTDINSYTNEFINIKNRNNLYFYFIIIICCNNLENNSFFRSNILFIIKKIDSSIHNNDELLNFDDEYNIILNYFNINFIEVL